MIGFTKTKGAPNRSYSVAWRDREGVAHSQSFEAQHPSHAILLAMEKIPLLHANPNLITQVEEGTTPTDYIPTTSTTAFF